MTFGKSLLRTGLFPFAIGALAFGLAACDKGEEKAAAPATEAPAAAPDHSGSMGDTMDKAKEGAEDMMDDAGDKAGDMMDDAGDKAGDMMDDAKKNMPPKP